MRLVFYYCNYNTLGHSATVFSLVKKLKNTFKGKIKIIVIEAGLKKTGVFSFEKYSKFYFYPLVENDLSAFKATSAAISRKKFKFLRSITDTFKPDIFITDYYPLSCHLGYQGFEHFLRYLRVRFSSKIVCSSPYLNWTEQLYDGVKNYYDLILLHYPCEFIPAAGKYFSKKGLDIINKTIADNRAKIAFTGFLLDADKSNIKSASVRKKLGLKDEKLILISRGGRLEAEKIIPSSFSLARTHKDWFFLISCGNALEVQRFNKYQELADELANVRIERLIHPGFKNYLNAADLSINMAGYNTVAQLLYFGKKTLAIPIDNTDQLANISFASGFIPCRITKKNGLSPKMLEKKITQLLNIKSKPPVLPKQWFRGLEVSAGLIGALV